MNAYMQNFKCLPAAEMYRDKNISLSLPIALFSVSSSCPLCLSEVTFCYFYHFIVSFSTSEAY